MGLATSFYRAVMRRNYIYVPVVLAGAYALDMGFETALNGVWEMNNRGKLYEHNVARGVFGGAKDEDEE